MYGTFVPPNQQLFYINNVFRTAISRPACISSARAPRPAPHLAMSKTRLSHAPQGVNLFDESSLSFFECFPASNACANHNHQTTQSTKQLAAARCTGPRSNGDGQSGVSRAPCRDSVAGWPTRLSQCRCCSSSSFSEPTGICAKKDH